MDDWEEEAEKDEQQEQKKEEEKPKDPAKNSKKFDDESEEIPVVKEVVQGTVKPKEKPIDYEKKYQEKKKDDIAYQKEIEESTKNIKDPELRLKKKLELQNLKQAEKFLGVEKPKNEENITLNVEKDFIALAQKNAAKINEANKLPMFTLSYLKNSIELLGNTLDSDQLNDLIKSTTVIFNKKLKEEGVGNKKKNAKTQIKAGKMYDRNEKKGLYQAYGGDDDHHEEEDEDYLDDEDFM